MRLYLVIHFPGHLRSLCLDQQMTRLRGHGRDGRSGQTPIDPIQIFDVLKRVLFSVSFELLLLQLLLLQVFRRNVRYHF